MDTNTQNITCLGKIMSIYNEQHLSNIYKQLLVTMLIVC